MINRFRKYLEFLDKTLKEKFEAQQPFIKCQKGCSYCCKEGEYPTSELEFVNMMFAYNNLKPEIKDIVNENIQNLIEEKREKLYSCPFLVNNECSIYEARTIICRTFGLISYYKNEKNRMPFCSDLNLNYSNILDKEFDKDEIKPLSYNIDRRVLRSNKIESKYDIYFGEDKSLIEWLEEEFST